MYPPKDETERKAFWKDGGWPSGRKVVVLSLTNQTPLDLAFPKLSSHPRLPDAAGTHC